MSKAAEMAKVSAKGSFHLAVGSIILHNYLLNCHDFRREVTEEAESPRT